MSRLGIVLGLLFVLVVAGGVYLFQKNYEKVPEEEWVGPKAVVRLNPLLAAERFLRAMGIPTEGIDNLQQLDELPPPGDVLVITTERLTLTPDHYDRLMAWVRDGGHLIARTREMEWDPNTEEWELRGGSDPLLERLDLELEYGDYLEGPVEVPLDAGEDTLLVDFDNWAHFANVNNADEIVTQDERTYLVHRTLGDGAVTVLGRLGFMENWYIDEYDHAEFLWQLVHLDHAPDTVWLVHFDEMPALWAWLWTHARPLVLTLLLLFMVWLLAVTRRFGPLQPVPPPTRRRLIEHVEAAGHFLWRRERRNELVSDVRQALDARMCRVHPGWADLSARERERHLARLTELEPALIHELLHREDYAHPQDFTRLIKTLETIRKQL